MALAALDGHSFLYPSWGSGQLQMATNQMASQGPIDATGEKIAFIGRVWFPARTGTKAISRVQFQLGTCVSAGGSGWTVSLQDVSLVAGPPIQPDETQDQTVALAAAAVGTGGAWVRTNALSANRTVTFGELLAVVIEYDGSGRLGSDSLKLSTFDGTPGLLGQTTMVNKVGVPAWAALGRTPNVVLEFSGGDFGALCLDGAGASTYAPVTYKNDTASPKEAGLKFRVPFPCKVDGAVVAVTWAAGADGTIVLYDGADNVLASFAVVAYALTSNAAPAAVYAPFLTGGNITLAKDTDYYLIAKPTTTTAIVLAAITVNDALFLDLWSGGTGAHYVQRDTQGSGAWTATTTKRPLMGVMISALDDGAGGAAGRSGGFYFGR